MTKEENLHWIDQEIQTWENECQSKHPIKEALYAARKALVQEPRWIPVSERLPEKSYGCLVTVYDTDLRTQDEFENILPYFVGYDGETWNNADGEPIPFEVTAWMPLPQPYKAESEG